MIISWVLTLSAKVKYFPDESIDNRDTLYIDNDNVQYILRETVL